MNWLVVAQLLIQYGLPVAEKIVAKWEAGTVPTSAELDELRVMGSQTAKDRLKAQLTLAGIPLDDPKAVALLALA